MSALRDEMLKKYGSKASASSGPTIVENKLLEAPATSGQPAQKTKTLREQMLEKYQTKAAKEEPVKEAPIERGNPVATKFNLPGDTISAAPEKTFLQKTGGVIKSGLQKVGILQSDKDKLAKEQNVIALTKSLNDRQYLEIGKQLGLEKTVQPKLPAGVKPGDETTINLYRDKEVIDQVKNNFPELKKSFGIEDPDQLDEDFVNKNYDAITKELGIRDQLTKKEYAGLMLTLGIGVATAGTVSLGAKLLPTLGKLGLGLAGFESINLAERKINKFITGNEESIAETVGRKVDAGPAGEALLFAADLFTKGKVLHGVYTKGPKVAERFTKDVITKYNLPKTVYIEPAKIKDIFQTGTKISPEELDMVKSLGLTGEQYKTAISNGVTIEIPAEKIITLTDKPYWARAKKIFGFTPTETILPGSGKMGETKVGPRGYLKEGEVDPTTTPAPQVMKTEQSAKVQTALKSPVSTKLIETINQFVPEEMTAFGRQIVGKINESFGTQIKEDAIPASGNIKFMDGEIHADGRPAQYKYGKIEVSISAVLRDVEMMVKGGRILAHPDTPKYSKVYEMKSGETIAELAPRYIKDILIHEKSHEKTMGAQDYAELDAIRVKYVQAKAAKNTKAEEAALAERAEYFENLEVKALEYERLNRAQLETEISGKKGDSTEIQRQIDRTVENRSTEKVTMTEKTALKERIKNQAAGSREGKKAGLEEGQKKVDETKKKYDEVMGLLKDKQSTLQQKRQTLVEYAEAFLPISERGKFLRNIKYPGSNNDFLDILRRMQKASDTVQRKGLITQISSELKQTKIKSKNGFPNVKFEIEAQKKLNRIRANIGGDYMLSQQKIADIVSEHQSAHPDDMLPSDLVAEIQLLKMVGIKEMNAKELRSVLADIQSLKETGRTLKELERFNRETEIEQAREKIYEVITGGQKLPSEGKSLKQPEARSTGRAIREFLTYQQYGLEDVLDSFSYFDKKSKPFESFLSRYVGDKTNTAFNAQNSGEHKQIEIVNAKIKEIYKVKKNTEVLELLNEMQKLIDLGKITHSDGIDRDLKISRGQAIQMKMWLQDPTLAETFSDSLKWGEAVIDSINKVLTPEDIKIADALLEFYQKYYETINPIFAKEYGIDLPFNENYSPVTRNIDVLLPENVLLAQEMRQYATAKNNSLKARVRSNIELTPIDAFQNVTRHIAKMEHYKAWSESMFEFRKIFGNKEVRQAILDLHGKTALNVMDNFLNDFARDGVSRERIVVAVDKFRMNATKALLGLNWRVGAKQLVGVLNYGSEMPLTDFFSGLAGFWSDPLSKSRFLFNNSATLRERFGDGFERDIKYAISKGYDKTLAKSKNWSEIMFILIRNADKMTVYQGSWAAYRSKYMEMKKAGKSDSEAKAEGIRYAEVVTNRVQESSRLDTLSPIQRGGSLAKLFTMFQSQPSKYLRIMVGTIRNYRAGRGSKTQNIKRFMWYWFVVPLIYNIVAEQFIDEEYKSSAKGMTLKTILGPLSYPLVTGQIVQTIFDRVSGKRFGYSPSPAFSFVEDALKSLDNLSTGDIVEATTYAIDMIGKLKGVPTSTVTKPTRRALSEEDDTPQGASAEF